jgi:hypothetical protein
MAKAAGVAPDGLRQRLLPYVDEFRTAVMELALVARLSVNVLRSTGFPRARLEKIQTTSNGGTVERYEFDEATLSISRGGGPSRSYQLADVNRVTLATLGSMRICELGFLNGTRAALSTNQHSGGDQHRHHEHRHEISDEEHHGRRSGRHHRDHECV